MADLCQTAGRCICSDHSGSIALLVEATKTIWVGSLRRPRVIFEVGGLYEGFRYGAIKLSVLAPIIS